MLGFFFGGIMIEINNERENIQSVEDRDKLDGKWECVMCFSCSTSCPLWYSECPPSPSYS